MSYYLKSPKKVLVAEDDKIHLKLYVRLFAGKGYALTTASSFAEASNFIENHHYDLLVTDQMLQDGLGTELIKLFEKNRVGARSILVTGSLDEGEMLELAGITVCFSKPLNLQDFMAAVAKALGN